jgi:hypothetical protein
MAIKFGDTIENQNTNYPIVDVVGDNVAGVHIVSDFTNGELTAIPVNARRQGSIVIAKDDGTVFVYKSADTADGTGSDNKWGHPAGTSWEAVGTTADGSIQLGSSVTLDDNNPAVSITSSTSVISAIDLLNETLGALVPAAPETWATMYGDHSGDLVLWTSVSSSTRRTVPKDDSGTAITHAINGNTGQNTGGLVTVNRIANVSVNQTWDSDNNGAWDENDLLKNQELTLNINDSTFTVNANDGLTDTVAAGANAEGGQIDFTFTQGNFPTSGDSAGFYQGINSIQVEIASLSNTGYNQLQLGTTGNFITKMFYKDTSSGSASVSNSEITLQSQGTATYSSGIKLYLTPTWKVEFDAANIIPSGALTFQTSNNWATFTGGTALPAPSSQAYTDITGINSNSDIKSNLSVTDYVVTWTGSSSVYGLHDLTATASNPTLTVSSSHGSATQTFGFASNVGNDKSLFGNIPTATTSNPYVSEGALYNGLKSTADTSGVRVSDGEAYTYQGDGTTVDDYDSTSTYDEDTPKAFQAWSSQYGNNADDTGATTVQVHPQDAIVMPTGASQFRIQWDDTNWTAANSHKPQQAFGTNYSGRGASTAQYITFKFPIDSGQSLQYIYLGFQGNLQSTGEAYVKIFDSGDSPSLVDDNSGSNGWLKMTAANQGTSSNGVPTVGCATGGSLSKTTTTMQSIKLDAGQQSWDNANDGNVYIRFKLLDGAYIERLAMSTSDEF